MEEERLLGVSITGIMDHPVLSGQVVDCSEWSGNPELNTLEKVLDYLRQICRDTNKIWADKLGIATTGHVTVVKPSGTVSLLTGTSSGIHPRYSRYYIRRVRQDEKDPLSQVMIDAGIPYIKDGSKYIFTFYLKSPDHSVLQSDIGAIKQLELWKKYADHWADGNPSQSIYYSDDEFLAVADWVWKNWKSVGGLSFFPKDDNVYDNPPLESITEAQYNEGISTFPALVDWSQLSSYEIVDNTTGSQTVACAGGQCELE